MKTKLTILIVLFSLMATVASAKPSARKGTLHLKGVVPLQTSVNFTYSNTGDLVPTLNSNAPKGHRDLPKIRAIREPASVSGVEKVEISAP